MQKLEARKIFSQKRAAATPQQRLKWDDLILIQFQNIILPTIHYLFTYAATETEVNTDAIVGYLHFQNPGMTVAYPVSDFRTFTMQAMEVTPETLFSKNKYGIPEPQSGSLVSPEDMDVIIVPMLCFDEQGYRVGHGKGFYDKYLAHTKSSAIKIGLSYFDPVEKFEDRNQFDVPLNYCVTPERMYEF